MLYIARGRASRGTYDLVTDVSLSLRSALVVAVLIKHGPCVRLAGQLCTRCRVVAVLLQAFSAFFCGLKWDLHVRVRGHALRHQQDPSQTYFSLILPETRRSDPAGPMKLPGWVGSRSLNMDSTLSFGPGPPAAMSISQVEKASPSAGFSHGACRLGVSWSQAQRRRLSD